MRWLRPGDAPLRVRVRRRVEALGRDVAMVVGDLVGRRPAAVIARRGGATRTATSASAAVARPMIVREVRRETANATVVVLAEPGGAPVAFVPGQFLTLLVTIDGEVHRRAYSICSDVDAAESVAVCAKRIAGGRVSTYLHERLRIGDVIPVLGPSGEFTVVPDAARRRHLVLVAGGSGITPILAIVRALLAHEPGSRATLVYGNRRWEDVIFRDVLGELVARYGERLAVRHVLEEPDGAPVTRGRLDRATVGAELERIGAADAYYVCGPAAAMAAVREELVARGVAPDRIHEERFATAERTAAPRAAQRVTFRQRGAITDVVVPPDATLLDAGLAAGVALPFSCAVGGCGACAVSLAAGSVDLDEPNCLSADERGAGRILTCVARPASHCTIEVS